METIEFAAIFVSTTIVALCIIVVYSAQLLDRWFQKKEEEYLYGNNE
jgi:hypothetical protein